MASDSAIFEAVADALIEVGANDNQKKRILASTMDVVGVPMMSIHRYRDDAMIVELFGERGVRFATDEEQRRG